MKSSPLSPPLPTKPAALALRAAAVLTLAAGSQMAHAATWSVMGADAYEPLRKVLLTTWGAQVFTTPAQEGRPEQARIIPLMGMGWVSDLGSPPGLLGSTAWGLGWDGAYALSEKLADGSTEFVARTAKSQGAKMVFGSLLQVPTPGLEQPGVIFDSNSIAVMIDTGLLVRRTGATGSAEDVRVNLAPGLKPIGMPAAGKILVADGLRSLAWVNANTANPVVTPLSVPTGALQVEARGVNDRGQVVGCMVGRTDKLSKAYLTGDNGVGFKTIEVPGAVESCALGVNRHGQVVGVAYPTRLILDVPRQRFAFITDPDGRNPRALSADAVSGERTFALSSLTHVYGIDLQGAVLAGDANAKKIVSLQPQTTCSLLVEFQAASTGGFTGKLTLTNSGSTSISGWRAGWAYVRTDTSAPWAPLIVPHTAVKGGVMGTEGANVTVGPTWFSGSIKPGASATVSFKAGNGMGTPPRVIDAFGLLGPNNCKAETRVLP